jgi:hypothetical protein
MKTLIITAAILLTSLFASAQSAPLQRPKQVIKVQKIFACYEKFAPIQQIKTTDSLKRAGYKPVDVWRIAGTRDMKVTFIKLIY